MAAVVIAVPSMSNAVVNLIIANPPFAAAGTVFSKLPCCGWRGASKKKK
jgi:hypothetical protein